MTVRVASHTDVGRHRPNNEDAFLAAPPLIAVADGMGGHDAGEVASSLAVEVLARWLSTDGAGPEGLETAVLDAHRAILDKAASDSTLEGMGTTLTAAWVDEGNVTLAHVGDSRA